MGNGAMGTMARQLGRLFESGTVTGLSEGQLLERFVASRDENAFEALVARHGPMVLTVCRQWLRDPNDVDDAFQATFLVLVRRAGTLRRKDLLGNWLYGVAYKVAARSRAEARRRAEVETAPADELPPRGGSRSWMPELHEELRRLPDRYRAPVLLCYLEGLTHEEAAAKLGWPLGTVKGRLARARDLLRTRLTRRGLTLGLAAAATELLARESPAAVPPALLNTTVRTAALAAAGKLGAAGAGLGLASAHAVALSEGVVQAMTFVKLQSVVVSLVVAGSVTGAGVFANQSERPRQKQPRAADKETRPTTIEATSPVESPVPTTEGPAQAHANGPFEVDLPPAEGSSADAEKQVGLQPVSPRGRLADGTPRFSSADRDGAGGAASSQPNRPLARDTVRPIGPDTLDPLSNLKRSDRMQADFARLLQSDKNPSLDKLSRLANWSKITRDADLTLLDEPANRHLTYQRHIDRMNALRWVAQRLSGPDRQQKVDLASIAAQQAVDDYAGTAIPEPTSPSPKVISPGQEDSPSEKAKFAGKPASGSSKTDRNKNAPGMVRGMTGRLGGGGGFGGWPVQPDPQAKQKADRRRVEIANLAPMVTGVDKSPMTKVILAKLGEPISMSFANPTPLEDVLKYIKSATQGKNDSGIPVYVDPQGLEDAEKTMASPVSLDLEGVPLSTTLRLVLKQLGLAYCVKDGLLMISTPEGIYQELMESASPDVRSRALNGGGLQ